MSEQSALLQATSGRRPTLNRYPQDLTVGTTMDVFRKDAQNPTWSWVLVVVSMMALAVLCVILAYTGKGDNHAILWGTGVFGLIGLFCLSLNGPGWLEIDFHAQKVTCYSKKMALPASWWKSEKWKVAFWHARHFQREKHDFRDNETQRHTLVYKGFSLYNGLDAGERDSEADLWEQYFTALGNYSTSSASTAEVPVVGGRPAREGSQSLPAPPAYVPDQQSAEFSRPGQPPPVYNSNLPLGARAEEQRAPPLYGTEAGHWGDTRQHFS